MLDNSTQLILIKYLTIALFPLILLSTTTVNAQKLFVKLANSRWEGRGTLMNSPATFKMCWSYMLDSSFMSLEFENSREIQETSIVFRAKAFYKVQKDSLISGTWFDSRGIILPLEGKILNNNLTIRWGNQNTEEGKTTYILKNDGAMVVEDYLLNNGSYVKFGSAQYFPKE